LYPTRIQDEADDYLLGPRNHGQIYIGGSWAWPALKLCRLLEFIQQEATPIKERIQKSLEDEYRVDGIVKAS
jgi:hypothetical protein